MPLNKEQLEVVNHNKGPLLVVAGAGTGKTRVLVEKICKLLNSGVPAKSILALTFTEKAASEMLERVLESRSGYEPELPIMTFNSFGESLLREFSSDAGISRNFLLMGDNAKIVFLRQHIEELNLDYYSPVSNPEGQLPDLADYFSKLKQHVITPSDYISYVKKLKPVGDAEQIEAKRHLELANAYKKYVELCQEYNVIDYDDQIYLVIQLIKSRPNIKKVLTDRFNIVMIDEFQDTNPMQSQLVDLLVNKNQNLVVVGDDDQSIYGFRGATLANILDFKNRYPKAKEVALTKNYRSSQNILDSAYSLIQNNNPNRLESRLGINKKLVADYKGKVPNLNYFNNLDEELSWLSNEIKKQISGGKPPGSIAVLCRRNKTAQLVGNSLSLNNIDHVVIGEKFDLYKTEVVRLIVEALNAIVNPRASTSLYHTLSGAFFNIPADQLATYSANAKASHQNLEEYILSLKVLPDNIKSALQQIKSLRQLCATLPVGKLVYNLIESTGYKSSLYKAAMASNEAAFSITQLSNFFKTLKEFESIALQPTTLQFLESYSVLEAAGEINEDSTLEINDQMVCVVTVHKSKGLEWDTVFIPDCTEGSFPTKPMSRGIKLPNKLQLKTSLEADEHYSEERRLMYVAMTRAKNDLYLSYSHTHTGTTIRKPSRFLTEIFTQDKIIQPTKDSLLLGSNSKLPNLEIPNIKNNVSVPKKMFDGKNVHLSVSQIVTFLNCPLDFYYQFILNVPQAVNPAAQYGMVIHSVIEEINKSLLYNKPLSTKQAVTLLDKLWNKENYSSKNHSERSYKQAKNTIEQFIKLNSNNLGPKPTKIEYDFRIPLQTQNIVISGRFDAVFETDNMVEIRDYKTTTTVDTPQKARSRVSQSDQLTLYALVWQEITGELPDKLSLEFVDTNQIGSIKKTQRSIDSMRDQLDTVVSSLKTNVFQPGNNHTNCSHPPLD